MQQHAVVVWIEHVHRCVCVCTPATLSGVPAASASRLSETTPPRRHPQGGAKMSAVVGAVANVSRRRSTVQSDGTDESMRKLRAHARQQRARRRGRA